MKILVLILSIFFGVVYSFEKFTSIEEIVTYSKNYFLQNVRIEGLSPGCNASVTNISLNFLDASTKIPTGIMDGNYFDLGNYPQCMAIRETINNEEIYGKYCLGTIPISTTETRSKSTHKQLRMLGQSHIGIHWAYCLPHTCTTEDYKEIFFWSEFYDQYCYTEAETRKFDAADIVAIVVLSIFLLLVICSTALDLSVQYFKKEINQGILLAFSIWSNGKKILQTTKNSDQLTCLHGLRALSMVWVIYSHVNGNMMTDSGIMNMNDVLSFLDQPKNMYLVGATVSVDTFFAVAGLLVMYLFLKNSENGVRFTVGKIPMYYFHRYLRLTPPLAILVLFNASLIRYMGNGPFWGTMEETVKPCKKYWWSALLYIQNFVNIDEMCSPQTWYLSVDMQLFLLSPIILIIYGKSSKIGFYTLLAFIVAGVVVPFTLTYTLDLSGSSYGNDPEKIKRYLHNYYNSSYARFGPYFIGMLFGLMLFKLKKNPSIIQRNIRTLRWIVPGLWLVSIGGLLATTYGGVDILTGKADGIVSRSLYNSLNRNAWAIAVLIAASLCCLGLGGPINAFLSLPIFQFLSKISYSMYLVHYTLVVGVRLMSSKVLTYFTETGVMHAFWGDFMITLFVSFIMCAVFESPIVIIEKVMFGSGKGKNQKKEANLPEESHKKHSI